MNVVLPELDGRIHSRAISFKSDSFYHEPTQCRVVTYKPLADRVEFVADLAANWIILRHRETINRKVGIILANYPNRDGRIANGVGYDTPASTIAMLKAMQEAGYDVGEIPAGGNDLIHRLASARAPQSPPDTPHDVKLSMAEYQKYFVELPYAVREQITSRWDIPETDPFFRNGAFNLAVLTFGNVAIGIQPARGYNIEPKATYHDAALVPPHGYLAFYFWLRHSFKAHALIHNGKHGNLEWLPGKANGLSAGALDSS